MPLSPAAPRKALHRRRIECQGFERADGLWDIEGHIFDEKTYDFSSRHRGNVRAGEPVHEMWLRLTVDDDLLIHAAEASTEHGPYSVCPDINAAYRALAGIRIGPGWRRAVRARVGGVLGCTHITELLGPVATTAYQTMVAKKARAAERGDGTGRKPFWIDTCHALSSEGPVVAEFWPQHARKAAQPEPG